jgi:predicted permease
MSWIARLRNTFSPKQLDEDLVDEVRDHIERRTADLEHKGLSPAEAQRRARLIFGNAAGIREESRELRLWAALESAFQDTRYAWRGLRRNPFFALTAIVSLGLAIGANTAIYSIVEAAMLRSLPVPEPDALFTLSTTESPERDTFSFPDYEQLRDVAGNSVRLALFDVPNRVEALAPGLDSSPEQVMQEFVSPDAFDVLGVPPALGRLLSGSDDRFPSPRAVVVLSFEYWQRRFGADPSILGQRMTLNGRLFSILGVARRGFSGVEPGKFVDLWLPITLTDPAIFTSAEFRPFRLLGRLGPGITRRQTEVRLQAALRPGQVHGLKLIVRSGANGLSSFRQTFARPLWILLGVAASILIVSCANLASLLLARSTARSAEMALRVSLGAGRARLLRQLLTESLLISFLAGICGWLFARIAGPALVAMVSRQADPVRLNLALDFRVLFFCAGVGALAALFFGLAPALRLAGTQPMFALRHASSSPDRWGASKLSSGRAFVAIQVAFAFCLVATGAGFLFSLHNLAAVDPGFDPKNVTVLTIVNDFGPQERDRQLGLLRQMQSRIAALPHVEGAATAWLPIFSGARRAERVVLPGKAPSDREETFYRVSPGYFATLRTPLLAGRDFTLRDNDNEPIPTIVNLAFARRYFGGTSVLGREFRGSDGTRRQIVGLAANSHYGDLRGGPEPIAYMPMKPPRVFTLYVRSTMNSASIAQLVEREANTLAPGTRVRDVIPLNTLVGGTILKERLLAAIGGAFAAFGLVLTAVGLFGLLNYSVVRRTKEIGIRTALGARRIAIYRLVLRELAETIAGGLVVGLAGSFALTGLTRSLLFGIEPSDPLVMGTATAVLLVAALVAGSLPAFRAANIDPLRAIRHE